VITRKLSDKDEIKGINLTTSNVLSGRKRLQIVNLSSCSEPFAHQSNYIFEKQDFFDLLMHKMLALTQYSAQA